MKINVKNSTYALVLLPCSLLLIIYSVTYAFYSEADTLQMAPSRNALQTPSAYIQEGLIPIGWWAQTSWLGGSAYKGGTLYGGVVLVGRDESGNYKGEYRASDSVSAIPKILSADEAQKYYSFAITTLQGF